MKRFIEGADRTQVSLLPDCVDDYVGPDDPVRVIEAFVDQLDLREMGFASIDPEATGRPAYHPSVLLKIYIYGYLNRVQSSRRLEHETQRNIELMWLTGRLMPDFKTIANFRKDNGETEAGVANHRNGSSAKTVLTPDRLNPAPSSDHAPAPLSCRFRAIGTAALIRR